MNKYTAAKEFVINQCLIIGFLFLGNIALGQTPATLPVSYSNNKISYVRTLDATAPEQNISTLIARPLSDVKQTTAYFDGLGRPLQTVLKKGSLITNGDNVDLVSSITYDEFGREKYKYLPFAANNANGNQSINDGLFKMNPFSQQVQFYNTILSGQPGETNVGSSQSNWAYGQINYEASPLSRMQETFSPGASWVGSSSNAEPSRHSVQMKLYFNTSADDVKIWTVTNVPSAFGTYAITGTYAEKQLHKLITVDEQGKQIVEFKNKEGKVILRKVQLTAATDDGTGSGPAGWLCAYYIYDGFNNLRCVLQPRGVELLGSVSGDLNANGGLLLDEQCFRYEYDIRNRMIAKKTPGAAEVFMVYDQRDRLVMTQDGNLRNQGKWLVTVYDNLDRPEKTGLITDNTHGAAYHISTGAFNLVYPNTTNPGQPNYYALDLLTQVHYDDYDGQTAYTDFDNSYINGNVYGSSYNNIYPYARPLVKSNLTKGLVTWTQTRVLGTDAYIFSLSIYDDKGRVIQIKTLNSTGGLDLLTTEYNWNDQPLVQIQKVDKQGSNPQTVVTVTRFSYDDIGRAVKSEKKAFIVGESEPSFKTMATLQYDALGQLKNKTLSPSGGAGGTPLENLVYDYNIRGWVLGTNRAYTKDTTSTTNHFGYELAYDKNDLTVQGQSVPYANTQFNGNLAGILWKSGGDRMVRRYDFSYDAVNRLANANFKQFTGSTFNLNAGIDFTANGLTYNANGNMLTMNQHGLKSGTSETIDSLLYTYQFGGASNRLKTVLDRKNDTATTLGDFRSSKLYMEAIGNSKDTGAIDYAYDINGNLTADKNKNITSTTYNHLNQPSVITVAGKGSITYTYDATGNKLKKVVQETDKPTRTTLYLEGAVYENDTLQSLSYEEGRIRYAKRTFLNGSNAYQLVYDYFLKDHLGNVRMVLTEQQDTASYRATMEAAYRLKENQLFYNIPHSNYSKAMVPGGYPTDGTTNPNDSLARVNGSDNKVGPALILKVMGGDKIDVAVKYFYRSSGATVANNPITTEILSSLAAGIVGNVGNSKGNLADLTGGNSPLIGGINSFRSNHNTDQPSSKPKAYLNWILLDEQLKYVAASSGAQLIGASDQLLPLGNTDIPITKNGFLYVYVSNETQNWNVFFDNLVVQHYTGPITEETHYYPFGLTMAGISSKALKPDYAENHKKFNKMEHTTDLDLNQYDAFYRNLDPQVGRWWQMDPKPNTMFSPYCSMGNNPVLMSDQLGDTTFVNTIQGVHIETIPDNLPNEVHFISGMKRTLAKLAKVFGSDVNSYAGAVRSLSKAFIGQNTIADMKSIEKHAEEVNREIGFIGLISSTREIRLTELPPDGNTYSETNIEEQMDAYYPNSQPFIFLAGHVHHRALLASSEFGNSNPNLSDAEIHSRLGTPTRRGSGSFRTSYDVDYASVLNRYTIVTDALGNNPQIAQVKGQSAALIVTPTGFTIFTTATSTVTNSTLVNHPILQGVQYESQSNYYLYKRFK